METLQQIWQRLADSGHETDKGSVHSYIDVYEKLLKPYRETAKNVLEIGLLEGHSFKMWQQYFTTAQVYGVDCDDQPLGGRFDLRPLIEVNYDKIRIMDASNIDDVAFRFGRIPLDVVIEDANHDISQQIKIYNAIKPCLAKGAIYIIEDIQDVDKTRHLFEEIDQEKDVMILDLRENKGRYDDCLVILTDKQ